MLGVPSGELAERHTPLEDLWGRAADEARGRIAEVASPTEQLRLFESILLARIPRLRGLHPAIADALALRPGPKVARSHHEETPR